MALESATYINGLNTSNPAAGDPVANAADHIRLIKSALKATFPNITGATTATQKNISSDFVPVGGVVLWYSTAASIPAGWGLCDGSTYAKMDGSGNITSPNMIDIFPVGAGNLYAQGSTGGARTSSASVTVGGHSLTASELPAVTYTGTYGSAPTNSLVLNGGVGAAHTHSASSANMSIVPPYLAVCWMIKL